ERPATLSPTILQGLLRAELGFDGVIVSDALDMAGASAAHGIPRAAVLAIAAGCDLLCIGTDNTDAQRAEIERALDDAVATGALDPARLADASARVTALARSLPATTFAPPAAPSFDAARTASGFDVRSIPGGPYTVVVL